MRGNAARACGACGAEEAGLRTVQLVREAGAVGEHGALRELARQDDVEREAQAEPRQVGQEAVEGGERGAGSRGQLPAGLHRREHGLPSLFC